MKNVDIISKVVGRKGEAMASPSKNAASFDLSGYLLKEVWDKCWEIRTTDQGEEYLFGKYPVAVQYGITSYVDGKMLDLPSIYDGLPIDWNTLYWELDENGKKTVLKAKGGTGGGGVADSVHWDNIEGKPDLSQYVTSDALNDALDGYLPLTGGTLTGDLNIHSKGELWVKGESYFGPSGSCYIKENSTNRMYISSIHGFDITNKFDCYLNYTGGGIKVNEGLITYNKDEGYFQFDGNLVVTGGLTTFADSGAGNQWIMDAEDLEEVTSDNKFKVYSAKVTSKIVESISEVSTKITGATGKLEMIKTAFSKLSSSSSASDIGRALNTLAGNLQEDIENE